MMDIIHTGFESGTMRRDKFVMKGTDQAIWQALCDIAPEIPQVQNHIGFHIPLKKRSISPYQAAALYVLAKEYHGAGSLGGRVLEIGTFVGYSAAWIASALPDKKIITLNPLEHERDEAKQRLHNWPRVQVRHELSWDYLAEHGEGSPKYDLIFVDGDQARVRADLPWLTHLLPGGLMLFHDYTPDGTQRPCPPVFEAINELAAKLRPETNEPDVIIIDQHLIGMVGFYKRPGDTIETTTTDPLADPHRTQ